MTKFTSRFIYNILFLLSSFLSFSQTFPVNTSILEETARINQLRCEDDSLVSYFIRPIYLNGLKLPYYLNTRYDSVSSPSLNSKALLQKGQAAFALLPLTISQQYNTHHPFGWNDGSMIPSRGYQSRLSAGFYSKIGPLNIQIQPEFVFAQNRNFQSFPTTHSDSLWKSYYYVHNRIDNPERFGNKTYLKVFAGQSSIRFNHKKLSLGISTENLWWGPGLRNSLIMSNNAPGFKHITFNTVRPVNTRIGAFEWQVIGGLLEGSQLLPTDTSKMFNGERLYSPKVKDDRYLNGLVLAWHPKWTKGLYLGFSRVFYQYEGNISSSLNGYLPVVTAFFKGNTVDENSFGRDQLIAFYLRYVLRESRAEFYVEYGKNDHAQNPRDFLLEPEHARAYIIGGKKLFTTKKQIDFEFFFEITHLQNPPTGAVREIPAWYAHHQIRHGYTNKGQVIGAGVGPGGSSQTIGLNWFKNLSKFGVQLERIVHNNDFYYDAFSYNREFGRHWVDLALSANKRWIQKRFIYSANLSFVRSLNYQWQYNAELDKDVDVSNLHAAFSVSYLFR